MRGFIEVVSPSSLFLGTVLSRVGCASAEAKALPAGKLVCPGGDLLDRYSIPSKAVRSDPRLRALPQAWRCLKEGGMVGRRIQCQKQKNQGFWRHSLSESTNWTLTMSKSLNAEEADDGLENCLLPSFGAPGRSRRVQSNEDTCLISASEMSVAYFPNRCIDENTEIVRKQHVGSRNSDAGKQETCLSLRHSSD